MQACHAIAITKDTCQKRIKIVAAQKIKIKVFSHSMLRRRHKEEC
jgi:hypothetical protein